MNNSPAELPDDLLAQLVCESQLTLRRTRRAGAGVSARVARFSQLYSSLSEPPAETSLIFPDPAAGGTQVRTVGNRLIVGRSPHAPQAAAESPLIIADGELSRDHFEIIRDDEGFYVLTDLDSTNGTFVNGERKTSAVLSCGAEIRAGQTEFIFIVA